MGNEILPLEKQLEEVLTRLEKAAQQGIYNDEILRLLEKRTVLQREISFLKKQETALPLDFPCPWDTGAPLPHVLSDGHKTFLIYYIGESNPKWNMSAFNIIDLHTEDDDITALVEFIDCYNYKFGGINDEVINEHPLYEHGLEAYSAHVIENSKWLNEQETMNAVHFHYSHSFWENLKHYIFTFHDEMFECIANDYKVDVFKGRIHDVFLEATKRLFS